MSRKKKTVSLEELRGHMSESMLRLNAAIFSPAGTARRDESPSAPAEETPEKPQSENRRRIDTLNKTERRYYDTYLARQIEDDGLKVFVQVPRMFELEGGGTYTPDFVAVREWGLEVIEIKGGYCGPGWEQGIERYKRVAAQYDCDRIRFKMATWNRKKAQWRIVEWKGRQ